MRTMLFVLALGLVACSSSSSDDGPAPERLAAHGDFAIRSDVKHLDATGALSKKLYEIPRSDRTCGVK